MLLFFSKSVKLNFQTASNFSRISFHYMQIIIHPPRKLEKEMCRTKFKCNVSSSYEAQMEQYPCYDNVSEITFLRNVRNSTFKKVKADLKKWENLRLFFRVQFNFARELADKTIETKVGPFTSFSRLVYSLKMLDRIWADLTYQTSNYVEEFTVESSGWKLMSVLSFGFTTIKYQVTKPNWKL